MDLTLQSTIHACPIYQQKLRIQKLKCQGCQLAYEGDFYTSPLIAFNLEYQIFVELFILNSGSLKEMARLFGITYPTIRNRLDEIISHLNQSRAGNPLDHDQDITKSQDKKQLGACPVCHGSFSIKKLHCDHCKMSVEGDFYTSPILALKEEQQIFVEKFVLTGGSLKEMAKILDITYPTLRIRFNHIIKELKSQLRGNINYSQARLEKLFSKKVQAELIEELINDPRT